MTKSHKISEVDLSELYQKRKQKHRAPAAVKRTVLNEARQTNHWRPLLNRIGGVAFAASTLLLVGLVALQQHKLNTSSQQNNYTFVELHSLEENVSSLAENVRHRYAQHYKDYLKQEQMLARHHKKAAVLSLFDEGWELETCDQELVKISNELVEALQKMDKIGNKLKTGDRVEIEFDKNGIIIGIHPSTLYPHC